MRTYLKRLLTACCIAVFSVPSIAHAQSEDLILPDMFAVKDVADDDVLNIRSEPGTHGEIIGSLGPADESIEVIRLSDDGRWGLVNQAEQAGWVSMRFMEVEESEYGLLDRQLLCSGTEPFWDVSIAAGGDAQLNDYNMSGDPLDLARSWATKQWYYREGPEMAEFQSGDQRLTASLTRGYCDDGMSDYEYGIIFVGHLTGGTTYSGCCSLTRW